MSSDLETRPGGTTTCVFADNLEILQSTFDVYVEPAPSPVHSDYLVLQLPCGSKLKFRHRFSIKHKNYQCSCCGNYFIQFKDTKVTITIAGKNANILTRFDILDI
tara:strand:- start:3297 stop:3611 length:315 start_codon:yes stop_codon:yes gene_type:complete